MKTSAQNSAQNGSSRAISALRAHAGAAATLAAALGLALSAPLSAQQERGGFLIVESGEHFSRLQAAIDAVGNREMTIEIAPGTYRQCAVQRAGIIHLVARQNGTAIFDGVVCEGKAALVLRGRGAEIRGLVFRNIAVGDGNGAGIRLEKSNLSVSQSRFADSQQGILAGDDESAGIAIDKVTFSGLGTCENSAGCAHSVYVGDYGELVISRSRFERGTGGHYVKSRAARVVIEANSFDDSSGHGTNYMIDLPAGGQGRITGNWFVQGKDKENYSAFIAVGAEDLLHPSDGLVISGNDARFVPGLKRASTFVADWTHHGLVIGDNLLAKGIRRLEYR